MKPQIHCSLATPFLLFFLLVLTGAAEAAPLVDRPTATRYPVQEVATVDVAISEALDLENIEQENAERERFGRSPRIASPQAVALSPADSGTWEDLGDGLMLWRLRVLGSSEATFLNLGFDLFGLPPSAQLRLYPVGGPEATGQAFSAADNVENGQLWTPPLPGNDWMVELTVPAEEAAEVLLRLAAINQGFQSPPNTIGLPNANTAPRITLFDPAVSSVHVFGGPIYFYGLANDAEDGDISHKLIWFSSLNGNLGTGIWFANSGLSVGTHTITVSAIDSGGLTGFVSFPLTVTATATPLTNGVARTGLADQFGSQKLFSLVVPAGAGNLRFETFGGTGNVNLFVKNGSLATGSNYDCFSGEPGTNNESCVFPAPVAGTYFVMLDASQTYSGVSLKGSYVAGGGGPATVTFFSQQAQDGRLSESAETSNVGGAIVTFDASTSALRLGDDVGDTQYKSIVSFNTSSLPDGATITAATLRLKRGVQVGTNPFNTHGVCNVDLHSSGFSGSFFVESSDFQAVATVTNVATMSNPTTNGAFSTGTLSAAGRAAINKAGTTQFRLAFSLDDNDDLGADYLGFFGGDAAAGNQPELVITYIP